MNKLFDLLVSQVLAPGVERIPLKYKTATGFVLGTVTYIAHSAYPQYLDVPMSWLGDVSLYTVLMGLWGTLFGVGLFHKGLKTPATEAAE